MPDAGKFLWPGPEEKKGKTGIHAEVNDFIGVQEEFYIRQVPRWEEAEEGDEEEVKYKEDFFDHTRQNYDNIWPVLTCMDELRIFDSSF